MADDTERVYTIPLGKVLLSPDNRRAMRAINMIREFARRHMKVQEIKIDQALSHEIWARGIRRPPRKVRVRMSKTEEGHVLVSPYSLGKGIEEPEAAGAAPEPGDAEPAGDAAPQEADVEGAEQAPKAGEPGSKSPPDPKPEPKKDAPDPKPEPKKDAPDPKPEPKKDAPDPKPEPKQDAPDPKPEPKKDAPDPKPEPKKDAPGG